MTCASELKPRMHFNEDPCEKIHSYTGELLLVLTIVKKFCRILTFLLKWLL